jgi:hypothetical protein
MESAVSFETLVAINYAIIRRQIPKYSDLHTRDFRYITLGRYVAFRLHDSDS